MCCDQEFKLVGIAYIIVSMFELLIFKSVVFSTTWFCGNGYYLFVS